MGRKTAWTIAFLLACFFIIGVPALLLMSWSWQVNETRQWEELLRSGLMIILPVVPLLLWYSRQ